MDLRAGGWKREEGEERGGERCSGPGGDPGEKRKERKRQVRRGRRGRGGEPAFLERELSLDRRPEV